LVVFKEWLSGQRCGSSLVPSTPNLIDCQADFVDFIPHKFAFSEQARWMFHRHRRMVTHLINSYISATMQTLQSPRQAENENVFEHLGPVKPAEHGK